MEHHESREKQTPIEFRCRKRIPGVEKSSNVSPAPIKNVEAVVDEGSKNSIQSPTPEKSDRKLSVKGKQLHDNSPSQDILSETLKSADLPDKLKTLAELFDRMCTSVRLLGLRKRLPTFQNIRTQVEIWSKRKFSHIHLAQMKYIFTEAIQIEKVLIPNERTLCMEPDLKVTIFIDILGYPSCPGQSKYMALCHAFRARLLEQFSSNQDAEIPEAVLPEPFNQKNDIKFLDALPKKSFRELPQRSSVELDSFSSASHFPSSFRKSFCHKVLIPETERTKILASAPLSAIADDVISSKNLNNFDITAGKDSITSLPAIRSLSEAICIRSPEKLVERTPNIERIAGDAISQTPSMQTPKRPIPSPIETLVSTTEKSVDEPKSTPSVRRTLIYSPQKMDMSNTKLDFDAVEPIPAHVHFPSDFSGKKGISEQETNQAFDAPARVNEAQKLTQPNSEKRQAIPYDLPAMFDTIRFICQFVGRSLITKQELVHKIISISLDIEDRSEVEEQLDLLEELAPDWICRKSIWDGEFLYCIKRVLDPDSFRTRLSEAV